MSFDDATLMAFADGELPEPRATEVAEAVARGEFENAETAARRAFPPAGTTDLAL